jgi:hypothetical protein
MVVIARMLYSVTKNIRIDVIFGSCWVTFVGCSEFQGFNYGILGAEVNSVVRKNGEIIRIFVCPLVVSGERGATRHCLKCLENIDLTKNI